MYRSPLFQIGDRVFFRIFTGTGYGYIRTVEREDDRSPHKYTLALIDELGHYETIKDIYGFPCMFVDSDLNFVSSK